MIDWLCNLLKRKQQDEPKQEERFIDSVENMEKYYRIAKDMYDTTLDRIMASDSKIPYYLVALSIYGLAITEIFISIGDVQLTNKLSDSMIVCYLFFIVSIIFYFLTLIIIVVYIDTRNYSGQPLKEDLNTLSEKPDMVFWKAMREAYLTHNADNEEKLKKKKNLLKKINTLFIVMSFLFLNSFILYVYSRSFVMSDNRSESSQNAEPLKECPADDLKKTSANSNEVRFSTIQESHDLPRQQEEN